MKYLSTRGGGDLLTFEEVVLAGLAPNGGLYIPERIPSLPPNWQQEWESYSFADLSAAVLALYISPDELSAAELRALVARSYSTFRHPDVTPAVKIGEREFLLELFHGPTFAFKDVALQLLGNLFEFFLARRNARKAPGEPPEKLTVVGATSGDTGSAAIYGLRGKKNVSIFILHPKGRVSPIQEAQMTTVTDSNVHNIAVKGTFDNCQDIVKTLFADRPFNERHRLGAVNSINWARILAQTVYYFLAYFHVRRQLPHPARAELQFVVPTGNFGDVLAGYYAKRMGLPMGQLVVATNANDILARFWRSGRYEKVDAGASGVAAGGATAPAGGASDGRQAEGGVRETLSPAMDILVSSNFERLLWYLVYETSAAASDNARRAEAGATVDGWMKDLKSDGRVAVPTAVLELARKDFLAERVSDEQTLDTIKQYFIKTPSYIADPHTAVGLTAAQIVAAHNASSVVQVVLCTAHPAKFSEAVTNALSTSQGFNFEKDVLPQEFRGLLEKERRVIDVDEPNEELVKRVIESKVGAADAGGGDTGGSV
ncbi:tryptophan synthase beta subunit-like PLP-dependent enzyme [Gloeopeniophorella convolvens]|nr:tryptophan synthase beta subunit-like PLP-dependent enzyme [Gloeopeniophorella convolvens]